MWLIPGPTQNIGRTCQRARRGRRLRPGKRPYFEMVEQNTQLTSSVKALTERVETLTLDMHKAMITARSD